MEKILVLQWDSFADCFIQNAFKKCRFELIKHSFPWKDLSGEKEKIYLEQLVQVIIENQVKYIFSINYFPSIAMVAKACRIKYISWTYDSPFVRLYSNTIFFDTNYIFVFDSHTCNELQELGANNVYYLPMAADSNYYDSITPSEREREGFSSEVAFVGSMYTEKGSGLVSYLDKFENRDRGFLEGIMQAQKIIYGHHFLEHMLDENCMERLLKICPLQVSSDGMETLEWKFAHYILDRKITSIERNEIMKEIEKRFDVKLYTPNPTPKLKIAKNMGTVEYYKDAPKVFKLAKINLNITLKSIVSGIPLRIFDIMGCGGFVITNYQSDFEGIFESGVDLVYYDNYVDLVDKIEYYLTHEDERLQIAKNGYEKVKKYHSYIQRIETMMDIVKDDKSFRNEG